MNTKKLMKKSEARIIIYLLQVPNHQKNVAAIAKKLEMDYGYCIQILRNMTYKIWLFKHRIGNKMFYDLTAKGKEQIKKAKVVANE